MRIFLLFLIIPLSMFSAETIPIDWTAECFKSIETENNVVIEYEAKLQAGRKLISTGIESYTGNQNIVLWYQVVQSIPESYRHKASFIIRWEVDKNDFLKWKAEKVFLLKQKAPVRLSEEQIREIKKDWK